MPSIPRSTYLRHILFAWVKGEDSILLGTNASRRWSTVTSQGYPPMRCSRSNRDLHHLCQGKLDCLGDITAVCDRAALSCRRGAKVRTYAKPHPADGRCAIEPFLPVGVLSARGTARTFNEAANKLIYKCVDHNAHKGGLTYNVGMLEHATCTSSSYGHSLLIPHSKRRR